MLITFLKEKDKKKNKPKKKRKKICFVILRKFKIKGVVLWNSDYFKD